MATIPSIRKSPIAGSWYSSDPHKLAVEIDQYMQMAALPKTAGELKGIIAPHAGYRYSGATAGYSFRAIADNNYDVVVILSPYHAYHPADILYSQHSQYSTPLGTIPIDQKDLAEVRRFMDLETGISSAGISDDQEHSLEIELPFLQRVLKTPFTILPFMIRFMDPDSAIKVASIIQQVISTKKALVVISTDLSHFYPQDLAERYDDTILKAIASFSVENVYQTERTGRGFACGLAAVMIGMQITRLMGANQIEILAHSTSAEQTGDFHSVVGYGAAAIFKTESARIDSNL